MDAELWYCNGTYVRGSDAVWRYAGGGAVPGAIDLTAADLLALRGWPAGPPVRVRPCTQEDLAWLIAETEQVEQVLVRRSGGRPPTCAEVVVGMSAPELQVMSMLTVVDIAELAGVSKATVDSYRYRGYLPAPQSVRGRTPLWSRPIVQQWVASRPGGGARTDIHGDRTATARHQLADHRGLAAPDQN